MNTLWYQQVNAKKHDCMLICCSYVSFELMHQYYALTVNGRCLQWSCQHCLCDWIAVLNLLWLELFWLKNSYYQFRNSYCVKKWFFVNNKKCIEAGYDYFSITKNVFKTNLKNRNVFSNIETECFVNFPGMLILQDFYIPIFQLEIRFASWNYYFWWQYCHLV